MDLEGFGVTGYRSVYGPLQLIGPLRKVNLLAGQNNAGKSNLLRYLHDFLGSRSLVIPSGLDAPRSTAGAPYEFAVARTVTDVELGGTITDLRSMDKRYALSKLQSIFNHPAIRLTDDGLAWFRYRIVSVANNQIRRVWSKEVVDSILASGKDYRDLEQAVTGRTGSPSDAVVAMLDRLSPINSLPNVEMVHAFRQITATEDARERSETLSTGAGLIRGLQQLQQPPIERQEDKQRFATINLFLKQVLGDESAELDIPYDASTILVQRGDLTLPLEYLGTGVHQVIILAAASTLIENSIVCMEEPEVHLHPLLQRKLIRYLGDHTSNQYLIATHSAHLLDQEHAQVFHVQHTTNGTEVQRAGTPQEVADVCADLGYRPSDLLQANAVIWVEGPSDRIYLRHWIGLVDSTLVEGIHYSIMFYGGRLLNHLTASDPEVEEFISLRRLNRHIAILIDSDKKTARSRVSDTKQRVRDEFDDASYPGFAWITDGRTIENYVPVDLLQSALASERPSVSLTYSGGKWDDPLEVQPERRIDKIKLAQAVTTLWSESRIDYRDLRARLRQMVGFIRQANGL